MTPLSKFLSIGQRVFADLTGKVLSTAGLVRNRAGCRGSVVDRVAYACGGACGLCANAWRKVEPIPAARPERHGSLVTRLRIICKSGRGKRLKRKLA